MTEYFYVYVLQSEKDGQFYTGFTSDLWKRLKEHLDGRVNSTKHRLPLKLVYWEGCHSPIRCHKERKVFENSLGKAISQEPDEKLSHGVNFVTVVVKGHRCMFGDIVESLMVHPSLGETVDACWKSIPNHHKGVELDDYVIMPNHVHGIIILNSNANRRIVGGRLISLFCYGIIMRGFMYC